MSGFKMSGTFKKYFNCTHFTRLITRRNIPILIIAWEYTHTIDTMMNGS